MVCLGYSWTICFSSCKTAQGSSNSTPNPSAFFFLPCERPQWLYSQVTHQMTQQASRPSEFLHTPQGRTGYRACPMPTTHQCWSEPRPAKMRNTFNGGIEGNFWLRDVFRLNCRVCEDWGAQNACAVAKGGTVLKTVQLKAAIEDEGVLTKNC